MGGRVLSRASGRRCDCFTSASVKLGAKAAEPMPARRSTLCFDPSPNVADRAPSALSSLARSATAPRASRRSSKAEVTVVQDPSDAAFSRDANKCVEPIRTQ
jgi:hypothetical protein